MIYKLVLIVQLLQAELWLISSVYYVVCLQNTAGTCKYNQRKWLKKKKSSPVSWSSHGYKVLLPLFS